jgi:CRP/FNR family transcriptional regulator, cyclic AMP receptor protein
MDCPAQTLRVGSGSTGEQCFRTRGPHQPQLVSVLEEDPDLGVGIPPVQWDLAREAATAPVFEFERGRWRFFPPPDPGGLGALVIRGMIVIRIDVGTRSHIEVVGEGDVISPWAGLGQGLAIPSVVNTSVVSRVRIALLDRRFTLRTARWAEIHAALVQRLIVRTRRLSLQAAINALSRTDERLDATLWGLAYRFGHVTPEGVVLDLPISHSQLADVVAAQRPSVSTAINRMQRDGRIARLARHRWLLCGEPPEILTWLSRQSGLES